MRFTRFLIVAVLLVTVGANVRAQPVPITTEVRINPRDTEVQGTPLLTAQIEVRPGGTLIVDGRHTIASLTVKANGRVTHDQGFSYDYGGGDVVRGFSLTVNGNVRVEDGGAINADGRGLDLNGLGAGQSGVHGAGGGHGGYGGSSSSGALGGGWYGSVEEPTEFGSGGGGAANPQKVSGGLGGGVIRLEVRGTLDLLGSSRITANGATPGGRGGGGSGGSVWIKAGHLTGSGFITANGGNEGTACCGNTGGGGAGGRVAVYYASTAFGGQYRAHSGGGFEDGAAGTVYIKGESEPLPDLIIATVHPAATPDTPIALAEIGTLRIAGGGVMRQEGPVTVSALFIDGTGSTLTHPKAGNEFSQGLSLTVRGDARITSDAGISADGRGLATNGRGSGQAGTFGSGAGHAGPGGKSESVSGGEGYGILEQPTEFGSGGGAQIQIGRQNIEGGRGGGKIRLIVDGTLTLMGTGRVSADGATPAGAAGGGSGGSVWITAHHLDDGGGFVTAKGGNEGAACCGNRGGGGSGGRVAVYFDSSKFGGTYAAYGGAGFQDGAAGTVYIQSVSEPLPDIIIASARGRAGPDTPIGLDAIDGITILGGGVMRAQRFFTANSLWIDGTGSTLTHEPKQANGLRAHVFGDVRLSAGGAISTDGRGLGSSGLGVGQSGVTGGGGGHGGLGGKSNSGSLGGITYGSFTQPTALGSGGGARAALKEDGGDGGGAIRLTVGGTLRIEGESRISANGVTPANRSGGGSGGSIWITAGSIPQNTGRILANGGNEGSLCCGMTSGGGAGGRIAIYACAYDLPLDRVAARGGTGFRPGCEGTIFRQHPGYDVDALSSSGLAFAVELAGGVPRANMPPPAFGKGWQLVHRRRDASPFASYRGCALSNPTIPGVSFVSTETPIPGVDEVTFDNCRSAFYRFTFALASIPPDLSLLGTVNADDAAVAWLNGNRISAEADESRWNRNYGIDCQSALTWLDGDDFRTSNPAHFRIGENELVFAVLGDLSEFEPTGLEFLAFLTHADGSTVPPVRIVGDPLSQTVCSGDDLMASVVALNPGGLSFRWRKDGTELSDGPTGTGSLISGAATPDLRIENASSADTGEYDCVVTNSCIQQTSRSARLEAENCCYADCDKSSGIGILDIFDFLCFQNRFAALDPYACDCDTSSGPGVCDIFDFLCFQNAYAAGCP